MNQQTTSLRAWMRAGRILGLGMLAVALAAQAQPGQFASQFPDGRSTCSASSADRAYGTPRYGGLVSVRAVGVTGCIASYTTFANGERGEIWNQLQAMGVSRTLRQRPLPALSGGAIQ